MRTGRNPGVGAPGNHVSQQRLVDLSYAPEMESTFPDRPEYESWNQLSRIIPGYGRKPVEGRA